MLVPLADVVAEHRGGVNNTIGQSMGIKEIRKMKIKWENKRNS
jgi:hypothetical protein